ncbi:alginate O-acetyltransferase AlgF [Paraburkholderia phenazinium]|uniref:Alginate biosynthesis protein AlgF n=1 Tax=Paraburkholderia phenazinium TaxID=60549 RepID=A0A1G8FXI4_9BURK|nr:alginate O-acetyltransferase AlgF [Paraburkholderia phenazinium]SDH86841.1 Alginate O-acetyl transferase AlgF [Paraburkholderia phenazinium]
MTQAHSFRIRVGRSFTGAAAFFSLVALGAATPGSAQEIARLYAPQAPAGSSYLRVVNPSAMVVEVDFAGKQDALDPKRKTVTDYRVVDASRDVLIKADGQALNRIKVTPGSFNTVILTGSTQPQIIADVTDGRDDLKAELRFYNLVRDCNATLSIQGGANVFERVASGDSKKRVINPVQARLQGRCDAAGSSAAVALPLLKSGDHASIFLLGDSKAPHLVTQIDTTEPYSGDR